LEARMRQIYDYLESFEVEFAEMSASNEYNQLFEYIRLLQRRLIFALAQEGHISYQSLKPLLLAHDQQMQAKKNGMPFDESLFIQNDPKLAPHVKDLMLALYKKYLERFNPINLGELLSDKKVTHLLDIPEAEDILEQFWGSSEIKLSEEMAHPKQLFLGTPGLDPQARE
jgi:hypothetical protein